MMTSPAVKLISGHGISYKYATPNADLVICEYREWTKGEANKNLRDLDDMTRCADANYHLMMWHSVEVQNWKPLHWNEVIHV